MNRRRQLVPTSRMSGAYKSTPPYAFTVWIWTTLPFLISNFRRVLNVVVFFVGNSQASEFYVLTFRNTLFHLFLLTPHTNMEQAECSETSAYKIHTRGNHPKERLQLYLYQISLFVWNNRTKFIDFKLQWWRSR